MKKMKKIVLILLVITVSVQARSNTKQGHWRWRADNGTDTTATFLAGTDQSISLCDTDAVRLRIEKYNDGGPQTHTSTIRVYYTLDGSNWVVINRADTNDFKLYNTPFIADSSHSYFNYTGSHGTFSGGTLIDSTEEFTETIGGYMFVETEYSIRPTKKVKDLSAYDFEILKNDDSELNGYLLPLPRLYTLFSAVQARGLKLTTNTDSSAVISWNKGNGDGRCVFLSNEDTAEIFLINDSIYLADTVFTKGTNIDNSQYYCVYYGADTTVHISGLNLGETYTARVYEYFNIATGTAYLPDSSYLDPLTFILKLSQEITFDSLPEKNTGDADFDPGAISSQGLEVYYSSDNNNVATIVNGMIHIVGAGTALITASQAGNDTIQAAEPVVKELTVLNPSSVSNTDLDQTLEVHPNPVKNGLLYINIPGNTQLSRLKLFSITGKIMINKMLSAGETSLRLDLPKGIYFITVDSGKSHYHSKVIVE